MHTTSRNQYSYQYAYQLCKMYCLWTINELKILDSNIWNSERLKTYKSKILKFLKPATHSISGCHDPIVVNLLIRLRLGLSHLSHHANTNSSTAFTIFSIYFAVAEKKLKLLLIFFFISFSWKNFKPTKWN